MKVVILCGGKGTRLREETEYKPKPLVMIGGKPILWHIMKIYSHFGHNEFILCLGYKGEMIKDYFLNFQQLDHDFTLKLGIPPHEIVHHAPHRLENWQITFVDTGLNANTGSRIAKIKDFIGEDEDFFVTYGDGLARIDIDEAYRFHKQKGKPVTVTAVRLPTTYGVMDVADGHTRSFDEKPILTGRVSGGFFTCHRGVFDYLTADDSCIFEEKLKEIAAQGGLAAYEHDDFWYGINTHKEWETINKMDREKNTPWKVWETN